MNQNHFTRQRRFNIIPIIFIEQPIWSVMIFLQGFFPKQFVMDGELIQHTHFPPLLFLFFSVPDTFPQFKGMCICGKSALKCFFLLKCRCYHNHIDDRQSNNSFNMVNFGVVRFCHCSTTRSSNNNLWWRPYMLIEREGGGKPS